MNQTSEHQVGEDIFASPISKLSKDIRQAAKLISSQEARYLVDSYYQIQDDRVRQNNRAFQAKGSGEPNQAISWLTEQSFSLEKHVAKMLDYYSASSNVGLWLRENLGIGPIIASGLIAYLDITRAPTAGHFWAFVGYVPNIQWYGKDKNKELILKRFPEWDLKPSTVLNTEQIVAILASFNRGTNPDKVYSKAIDRKTGDKIPVTLEFVAKRLSVPPFNPTVQKICYNIGESFVKVQNKEEPNYGHLIVQRKQYENEKNERGDYANIAKEQLSSKNWDKNKDAFKILSSGRLTPIHIHKRSKRWAVHIFLSHLHEMMYRDHFKRMPPKPFAIEHLNHVDYIPPFVPFENYL